MEHIIHNFNEIKSLAKEPAFKRGFKHGAKGSHHYFDPPLDNYEYAFYQAGWNAARNSDLKSQMSTQQARIINSILKGDTCN